MTKQQIIDFVNNNVKVSMGRISAYDNWTVESHRDDLVEIKFMMLVMDRKQTGETIARGKEPHGNMFHVGTSMAVSVLTVNDLYWGSPEENLLMLIQQKWTSLWMHEAKDKREAIKLGVKQMLRERMDYVMDQRSDGCSPYTGVKAE